MASLRAPRPCRALSPWAASIALRSSRAEAWTSGTAILPPTISSGSFREGLPVLPNPMGVDRRHLAGRRGGDVSEHGERNIEMIVGVRAPGQPEVPARLRDPDRALHRPEMGIGKGNVDRMELDCVAELAPVGRDHVGGGRQAGRATELRHDFAPRKPFLGAARVLGIGEHALQILAKPDRFLKRPGAVRNPASRAPWENGWRSRRPPQSPPRP